MARCRPSAPLRNGAGGQGQLSSPFVLGVAMRGRMRILATTSMRTSWKSRTTTTSIRTQQHCSISMLVIASFRTTSSMSMLATVIEWPQWRQGGAPPTLMVPYLQVTVNLVFGLILRRSRKIILELLLSTKCVVRDCLLDLLLVLVILLGTRHPIEKRLIMLIGSNLDLL